MANRTWSAVLTPEQGPVLEGVRMELCQASLVHGDADVTVYAQYLEDDLDLEGCFADCNGDSDEEEDSDEEGEEKLEKPEKPEKPKKSANKTESKKLKKAESSDDEEDKEDDDDTDDDDDDDKLDMDNDNEPFVICRLNKYAPSCTLALDLEGSFQFMIKVNTPNSSGAKPEVALVGTFDPMEEDDDEMDFSDEDEEFEPAIAFDDMSNRVTDVTSEDETAPESTKASIEDSPDTTAAEVVSKPAAGQAQGKKGKKAQNKRPAAENSEPAAKKAKESSAVVRKELPEGVKYEMLSAGSGKQATPGKKAKVRYEGRLASNGRKFDSGVLDFVIGSGDMIKGFDVGVRGMLQREQRRVWVPSRLAYGRQGTDGIPPNSDLIFDVTLLGVH